LPEWVLSINKGLLRFVRFGPIESQLAVFLPLGLLAGWLVSLWSDRQMVRESGGARRLPTWAKTAVVFTMGAIFPGLHLAVFYANSHWITEGGSVDWGHLRLLYHYILIALLATATVIDLDQYLIPDEITVTGCLLGIGLAAGIGNMQLMQVWVDWNQVHPIQGPYIPEWIKFHPHWHGLVFSLAGLMAGAGITWLVRIVARCVLGMDALGFGDVTLMAMIGSFLGWQPVVFVFLLAPMCGMVAALILRFARPRQVLPYGPFLSVAAILVLFFWRWLWTPTREIFGHWPTLVGLVVLVTFALAGLLGLLRLYRAIPVERRSGVSGNRAGEKIEDRG
jgi:leader peptidase (prepilin peptidase)/N-methyltransferase